jgi:hypothetical protein
VLILGCGRAVKHQGASNGSDEGVGRSPAWMFGLRVCQTGA